MKPLWRGPLSGGTALLLVAAVLVAMPAASADTNVADGRYVALGDSYSSGKGVEPYEGTNGSPHPCYRSFGAYPRLLADRIAPADFEFWACSGAHSYQLSRRSVVSDEPPYDDPARVQSGSPYQSALDRLGPDVTLATVTIGGHDAGFGDVMFDCIQPFWLGRCDDIDDEVQADLLRLPSRLIPIYRAMRAKIHPEGRLLVLGYPKLFPDDPGGICLDGGFISASERRWLNDMALQLNSVIEDSVSAVEGVEFVDVAGAFWSHEICGDEEAYLTGISVQHPSNSFHPNYKGQRAMADAIEHHLATVPSPVTPPPPDPPPPPPPPPPPAITDSVGAFDPDAGLWALSRPDGSINAFFYGIPGDLPLFGDWDCDGVETVGMYRPDTGFVYLRNVNRFGVADQTFFYGVPGDVPVAGDWDGDGCDTLAIFRPSEDRVFVSNTLGTRPSDFSFAYGETGWSPFAGDFDGDGGDSIGFLTSGGVIVHKNDLGPGPNDFGAYYGRDELIVAGDWDGDGTDTLGARASDGSFRLWNDWSFGPAVEEVALNTRYSLPVAGHLGS
ncbi:MAG: SGNH/GDSL hydrolase family protein [Acidimicrobiia bacterium]|nr:SGNH/GDSL hydrolase family protein [Acidimicrobiia bacterium]NNF09812.1 SGNH/GDSL hydrolase family protein [Acidimicrobiia bacterium]